VAGYQTYPHVDMRETGLRAGSAHHGGAAGQGAAGDGLRHSSRCFRTSCGRASTGFAQPRNSGPLRARWKHKASLSASGVRRVFRNADVPCAGLSAVVVTDGDAALAQRRWCDELLDMAWNTRADFVYEVEPLAAVDGPCAANWPGRRPKPAGRAARPLATTVRRAARWTRWRCWARSSTPVSTTWWPFAIYDPAGGSMPCVQPGWAPKLTLPLGGKLDMPVDRAFRASRVT
jgi:hypothetical protein